MNYDECLNTWNEIRAKGLKQICMPNHEIAIMPETYPFWQWAQDSMSEHYRNSCCRLGH